MPAYGSQSDVHPPNTQYQRARKNQKPYHPRLWNEREATKRITRARVPVARWSASTVGASFHWRVDLPESLDFIDWVINTVLPCLP